MRFPFLARTNMIWTKIPKINQTKKSQKKNHEKRIKKSALRGVAIQRGRAARAAYPTAGTAAAAAAFRLPTPLAAAAGAANALHGFAP